MPSDLPGLGLREIESTRQRGAPGSSMRRAEQPDILPSVSREEPQPKFRSAKRTWALFQGSWFEDEVGVGLSVNDIAPVREQAGAGIAISAHPHEFLAWRNLIGVNPARLHRMVGAMPDWCRAWPAPGPSARHRSNRRKPVFTAILRPFLTKKGAKSGATEACNAKDQRCATNAPARRGGELPAIGPRRGVRVG